MNPRIFYHKDSSTLYIMWGGGAFVTLNSKGEWGEAFSLPGKVDDLASDTVWQEAFDCGRAEGYDDGYDEGYSVGRYDAEIESRDGW